MGEREPTVFVDLGAEPFDITFQPEPLDTMRARVRVALDEEFDDGELSRREAETVERFAECCKSRRHQFHFAEGVILVIYAITGGAFQACRCISVRAMVSGDARLCDNADCTGQHCAATAASLGSFAGALLGPCAFRSNWTMDPGGNFHAIITRPDGW